MVYAMALCLFSLPSSTSRCSIKMAKHVMPTTPHGSTGTLSFVMTTILLKFQCGHPNGLINTRRVRKIWLTTRHKLHHLRNDARDTFSHQIKRAWLVSRDPLQSYHIFGTDRARHFKSIWSADWSCRVGAYAMHEWVCSGSRDLFKFWSVKWWRLANGTR